MTGKMMYISSQKHFGEWLLLTDHRCKTVSPCSLKLAELFSEPNESSTRG
jgi:hypothetical protein